METSSAPSLVESYRWLRAFMASHVACSKAAVDAYRFARAEQRIVAHGIPVSEHERERYQQAFRVFHRTCSATQMFRRGAR